MYKIIAGKNAPCELWGWSKATGYYFITEGTFTFCNKTREELIHDKV